MHTISAYYFPSTVFLVDDDALLLAALQLKLPKNSRYQTCSVPLEALPILENSPIKKIAPPQLVEHSEQNETNRCVLDLNFNQPLKWLASDDRFDEISVLIVDYTMPRINGIQLATYLRHKPFKIILLTGEPDQDIAIKAFNDGLIDRYISKTTNLYPLLTGYIKELQEAYFVDRSRALLNFVVPENQVFETPAFKTLFHSFLEKHAITEYYIVNCTGAFLLLDTTGKAFYLDLQSEADLSRYTDIAIGNEAPNSIIQSLTARSAMPVFLSEADHDKAVSSWQLHPITALETDSHKIFYTFFELSPAQYQHLRDKA